MPGVPKGPRRRFTPHAAKRRFERSCALSLWAPMARTVLRRRRASASDCEDAEFGFGSRIGGRASVVGRRIAAGVFSPERENFAGRGGGSRIPC
jgi:hypothetical protein